MRGIAGLPCAKALKEATTQSWQGLHDVMKGMTLEAVVNAGGFFCALQLGYHCCNAPGMILWEFPWESLYL